MIFTLFKKELKETLRDRRTILMMIIIPTLVFPVIMTLFMSISEGFQKEIASKNVKIGVISPKNSLFDKDLAQLPNQLGKKTFIQFNDTATLIKAIKNDSIQLGFVIPQNTDETLKKLKTVSIKVFHNGSDLGMKERAEVFLTYIQEKWTQQRLVNLEISQEKITPLQVNYENIASSKEMIGKLAGGFLPYMFIAFGFMGCMFPAIDLFTGEKERMTIETLLTTPVSRWKILVGKMGVVVLSGLTAATFNLVGIYLAIEVFDIVKDPEVLQAIQDILSPAFIILLFALLIPLIIFFAGIMVPIAVRAKSFKEAQSIISPLNIVVLLPAMIGFFPGIELNEITAIIPIVNIVLATKELMAGTLEIHLVIIAFVVMLLLAALSILLSYKRFDDESTIAS